MEEEVDDEEDLNGVDEDEDENEIKKLREDLNEMGADLINQKRIKKKKIDWKLIFYFYFMWFLKIVKNLNLIRDKKLRYLYIFMNF